VQQAPVKASLAALIDSLRNLPGQFSLSSPAHWQFSADPSSFAALFDYGDSAVVRLVDCLNSREPATATLDGHRVTLGVMCGYALQLMASATEYEDDPRGWAGVILPRATPAQLDAAKKAWQEILRRHAYSIQ